MAVKSQVKVFWVVMLCNGSVQYQCFRGLCCLHLQGEVNGTGKGHRYKPGGVQEGAKFGSQ